MQMKKCEWVSQQTREASQTGSVHVRSGTLVPVWMAFRCVYCGEYFNQTGAEQHFGKSRIDFIAMDDQDGDAMIEVADVETGCG